MEKEINCLKQNDHVTISSTGARTDLQHHLKLS